MNTETLRKRATKERISKGIVLLFFAVLFLYGCFTFDDYGISSDEPLQRRHSLVMYNDLFLKNEEYVTDIVDTRTLPTLEKYGVNYGVILQLPLIMVEHWNGFKMNHLEIYAMRHLYSFLWFFVSVIYFYRLAMVISEGDRYQSLLGTMIYVLGPRTFADSFYNIKDALCMALFTISIYYGVMTIRKLSFRNMVPFILFSALCTASRIVGGVVVAAFLLVLFAKSVQNGTWKKMVGVCALMGALFGIAFIMITPNAWKNIPGTLLKIIKTFSNYTIWDSHVKYFGQWIKGSDLPWHYLFVWIGMTVPGVYLILSMLGVCSGVKYCLVNRRRMSEGDNRGWIYLALLLILVIPFFYVIIVRPVLYNGWRHFYFMYSVIAAWAAVGIYEWIRTKMHRVVKWGGMTVVLCSLVWVGLWILRNHPYEYVYFNPWIKEYAADNFQRDYWFVTDQEAMQYILDHDERTSIPVYSYQGYTWLFQGTEDARLRQVSWDEAEYIIADEERFAEEYLFEKVYSIVADGMDIRNVYQRVYEPFKRIELQLGGEKQTGEVNGAQWTKIDCDGKTVYQGIFEETMPTDVLVMTVSEERILQNEQIEVLVSADGERWHEVKVFPGYTQYQDRMSAECSVHDLKEIQIVVNEALGEDSFIEIVLCGYLSNVKEMDLTNPCIHAVESNVVTDTSTQLMMDADPGTRWSTPAQLPGMYVIVELQEIETISGIKLELGDSPWDHPRNLQIFVSRDGDQWEILDIVTENNEMYSFVPITCKYLKLQLGKTNEEVPFNWSIYELRLFSPIE